MFYKQTIPIDIRTIIGNLNDLWRYRVNDSTWTWIAGSNTANQLGMYGEKGIPNSANHQVHVMVHLHCMTIANTS